MANNLFLKYASIYFPIIYSLASIQYLLILDQEITLKKFFIPTVAALILSYFSARSRKFQNQAESAKYEKRLIQTQKMNAIGLLSSGIMHDFNNILQIATMSLKTHENRMGGELPRELVRLENALQKGEDLVHQLMSYIRTGETESSKININELVDEVLTLITPLASKELIISRKLQNSNDLVYGVRSQIFQVFFNLCVNAIEASKDNKRNEIFVETYIDGDNYCAAVTDSGGGVIQEDLDGIFEAFNSTKSDTGVGLGLHICKMIVKQHDGEILVTKGEEGGAKFTICFPLVK